MTDTDLNIVCSTIEEEKQFLNAVSQDIWKMPELAFKEVHAHAVLTSALSKFGFPIEKHYFLTTAFRAEYCVKAGGPTVAIILEYDALPDIGHACGHNLIAEAGLAAAMAVKKAMENDRNIAGKLVVLGTPGEEEGGGKIRLIELGAFEKIDVALMVHPTKYFYARATSVTRLECCVEFKGKEAHAAAYPWEGRNALDAAVMCYNNIAVLRQQMKPTSRIHVIIKEGGTVTNIIPARSKMSIAIRSLSVKDLKQLRAQVEACIKAAANATGCTVESHFDESNCYYNVFSNKVIADIFETHSKQLGVDIKEPENKDIYSTDMGNVCHVIPSIHALYPIPTEGGPHTKAFAQAAKASEAQEPTLTAAKALALTCLTIMRNEDTLQAIKQQFIEDMAAET